MKRNTVRCPYCGYVFTPDKSDLEMVDKIETYWCRNEDCGEQFVENLEIKDNKSCIFKKEWQ